MAKNGNGAAAQDDGWLIDLNAIKAKEIAAFQAAFNDMQAGGIDVFWPWAVRIVKRWPFDDLDPANIDSYGELGLIDFRETIQRLGRSFRGFITDTETATNSLETSGEGNTAGPSESA